MNYGTSRTPQNMTALTESKVGHSHRSKTRSPLKRYGDFFFMQISLAETNLEHLARTFVE